ncbi:isoprenylcysteine carboxyl methyltransferase family protein [Rudaeicoccus suwonensis]|uniref:Alkylresorcinol O-methyltransferase n=1 Tax=Rudaeicoccus suwonensis TaxID=657409 RepID=A0A561E8F6_9MICO|nr:isoprenylcysteine carboxyl methyltransferase family protein [Rudaeicoccus suwonensis]TWE11905.1 alkylresorcinol O-methyltransferase [Rudaeicoccus suwonensis]
MRRSVGWYVALVAAVSVERVAELVVARRHQKWAMARGAVESGRGHYPVMVALHTGLLVGCLAETHWRRTRFNPSVGYPMVAAVVAAQGLRWWCITTLGPQWNTRVLVIPDVPLVTGGPYRWLRHPNYVAVVTEGLALPLVHSAGVTATTFSILDAALLTVRIRTENRALAAGGRPHTA